MYSSQTEASWARSAKLTEFQRVKEAVRRLEHNSQEQLVRHAADEQLPWTPAEPLPACIVQASVTLGL